MHYLVVIERADENYSAYAPDVPGCVATGDSIEETIANYRDALSAHLEAMIRDGDPLPHRYSVEAVDVDVRVPAHT